LPTWEDYYRGAAPEQQAELMRLAGPLGILYGHQLPAIVNGSTADSSRLINRLLAGKVQDLEPLRPVPVEHALLDQAQREAVAKALATPDVCLIQGLPATGKSRVVAEIVIRAAARGERVLLLSPWPAVLDRILGLVAAAEPVCPVRCLGKDECAESLVPAIRGLVFPEKVRQIREEALQHANQAATEAGRRANRRALDAPAWAALLEMAEHQHQLSERAEALRRQRAGTPAEVEAAVARLRNFGSDSAGDARLTVDVPPAGREAQFELALAAGARAFAETETRVEAGLAELSAKIEATRREAADCKTRYDSLAPLAAAKAKGRWWTAAWWRATFQTDVVGKAAEARQQVQRSHDTLVCLEHEIGQLNEERRQAGQREETERTKLVTAEIACRCAELDQQDAAVSQEQARLDEQWREAVKALDAETPRPTAKSADDIRAARAGWQAQLEHDESAVTFAGQWLEFLRQSADSLARCLRDRVNLVAATTTGLACDAEFGESAADPISFDVLVLLNAEQLSEAEFLAIARRARRWVLVADASDVKAAPVPGPNPTVRGGGDRRKPATPRPGLFQRLWQQFHCDPRRLAYCWEHEPDGRLCCRLRTVSPDQRRWLECERVADLPDIELRIVAPPRGAPPGLQHSFLAEVVFPPSMSLRECKEYIFRELQELPVRARAHSLRWVEQEDRLMLHLGESGRTPPQTTSVELGRGVRELVAEAANGAPTAEDGWHTWGLEFDRAAGFDRSRAEEWARRHVGACDLGRTLLLDAPQGIHPSLAAFLADVLFPKGYRLPTRPASSHVPVVEFVSVPASSSRVNAHNPKWAGGAGQELDLADARHRDRLPAELRSRLGEARGLVNYLEAQAIVRAMDHLLGGQNGCSCHPRPIDSAGNGSASDAGCSPRQLPASIHIAALYPAQAQLIRLLLDQKPEIAASRGRGVDIRVGVPADFRGSECDVLLLSLTRSHTHRAVSYGEGPSMLAQAMMRARGRLFLFGDPGTLARRSQWQGPLDHLDEHASEWERTIIAQLLSYLQGQGTHAAAFGCQHPAPVPRFESLGTGAPGLNPQARQATAKSRA
jgi:hypothetical protein